MSKGRRGMPYIKQTESKFTLSLCFCSIQALNRLREAHPPTSGRAALLRQRIQMPVSFRDTVTNNTSQNTISLAVWAALSPVTVTHKSNHQLTRTYSMTITAGLIFDFC